MSGDVLDRLRKALADRYAIEREIGSGGMATVYHGPCTFSWVTLVDRKASSAVRRQVYAHVTWHRSFLYTCILETRDTRETAHHRSLTSSTVAPPREPRTSGKS